MSDTDGSTHHMRGIILALAGVLVVVLGVWIFLVVGSLPSADPPSPPPPAPAEGPQPEEAQPAADVASASALPNVHADPAWVEQTSQSTGIPVRALQAYATAHLIIQIEQPDCGLSWNTLAGIGLIETAHGSHGGAVLGTDGRPEPPIRGAALDGNGVAAIPDTDGGSWDGDAVWDRAVGPMQFIPDTWSRWGVDADGDGRADPNQIDDAALAAGRYLCASGEMRSVDGWRGAVFSYNHLDTYVDAVAEAANRYATSAA